MTKNPFNAFSRTSVTRDYYHVRLTEPSETPVRPEILERGLPDKTKLNDMDAFYDYLTYIEIFRTKKISAAGLIAFNSCDKAGIYPPEDLIKWFSAGIEKWITDGGKTDFEKTLRLSKVTSGNTRSLDQVLKYQRDVEISDELRHLMENFNLETEDAATMIQNRLEKDNIPNIISASTIVRDIKLFMKTHDKIYGLSVSILTEEQKKEVLKSYPYIHPSIK